ncbi:GNAT family N-acetyltransferase [Rhodocytophaga rosea]|uniref:GNAT family N-acetyltransferase n=1 Tax=Rhodocytophaga rosea TaxID=2704465 RepID=A0A6C0GJA7_9BACT|nr:GNAT family N-acetyltransferase [Rhodocytophaga rosea]QHT68017.1 GNAT family N-acetyltransferase [Rhodocytophaga rosea]
MEQAIIRKATEADKELVWKIIQAVIHTGDTYVFDPDTPKETMMAYWFAPGTFTFVAELNGNIAGTFVFRQNQPGLGSHVANAGYMVHPDFHGKGIGKQMAQASLEEARKAGFLAMQFNIVVSTNHNAKKLWDQMGFVTIGVLPKVFNHTKFGLVDAYVMHRFL